MPRSKQLRTSSSALPTLIPPAPCSRPSGRRGAKTVQYLDSEVRPPYYIPIPQPRSMALCGRARGTLTHAKKQRRKEDLAPHEIVTPLLLQGRRRGWGMRWGNTRSLCFANSIGYENYPPNPSPDYPATSSFKRRPVLFPPSSPPPLAPAQAGEGEPSVTGWPCAKYGRMTHTKKQSRKIKRPEVATGACDCSVVSMSQRSARIRKRHRHE